jgi:hypothetical protein
MKGHGGMILTRKTKEIVKKSLIVPLRPTEIPHGLTRASDIRSYSCSYRDVLDHTWQQLNYALDVCQATNGATERRVQRSKLLPRIQEVTDLNLGPETSYNE